MVGWHSGLNSNVLDNWTYCIFFIHFSIKLIFSSDLSFYIPVLMFGPIPRGSILINNDFLSSYRRSRLSHLFLTVKTIIINLTKMILFHIICNIYIFRFMLILECSRSLNSRKKFSTAFIRYRGRANHKCADRLFERLFFVVP